MKAYRENRCIAALISNLFTRWGQKTSSSLGCFMLGEELPLPIDCEAGWMLEAMWIFWRRDKCLAQLDSNPGSSSL